MLHSAFLALSFTILDSENGSPPQPVTDPKSELNFLPTKPPRPNVKFAITSYELRVRELLLPSRRWGRESSGPRGDAREGLVGPCDAGCHTGRISATYRHVTVMREFTRGKPPIARFACPLPQNVL